MAAEKFACDECGAAFWQDVEVDCPKCVRKVDPDLNVGQALAAINSGKTVEQNGAWFRLPSATEAQSYILAVGVHQEVFAWSRDSGKTWLRQSHISVERILATDWRIVKEEKA